MAVVLFHLGGADVTRSRLNKGCLGQTAEPSTKAFHDILFFGRLGHVRSVQADFSHLPQFFGGIDEWGAYRAMLPGYG
ncbi:hypothetical protein [Microvirga pakistanensis]|uniref:hypothetical protein n=1 Tax=Microvirga pakistanensis TaxID=1682650 RepID=UPI00106ABBAB|nr:hypothetical protein [Microvirga pakistanensis]